MSHQAAIRIDRQQAVVVRASAAATLRGVACAAVLTLAATGVVTAQDVMAGAKVFADQKCSVCHSIAGKGNFKGPIDDVGSRLTADELHAWIADAKGMTAKTKATRKPEMKAYALPKDDVAALVAYLLTLKTK